MLNLSEVSLSKVCHLLLWMMNDLHCLCLPLPALEQVMQAYTNRCICQTSGLSLSSIQFCCKCLFWQAVNTCFLSVSYQYYIFYWCFWIGPNGTLFPLWLFLGGILANSSWRFQVVLYGIEVEWFCSWNQVSLTQSLSSLCKVLALLFACLS